jgi:hypothetical protein
MYDFLLNFVQIFVIYHTTTRGVKRSRLQKTMAMGRSNTLGQAHQFF